MFWPLLKYQFFHSKPLSDNCKFHIIKDERRRLVIFYWKCAAYKSTYLLTYLLVSKMEGKTNFSRRLKQFDGLTWPTPTPISYDRSTALAVQIHGLHWHWRRHWIMSHTPRRQLAAAWCWHRSTAVWVQPASHPCHSAPTDSVSSRMSTSWPCSNSNILRTRGHDFQLARCSIFAQFTHMILCE